MKIEVHKFSTPIITRKASFSGKGKGEEGELSVLWQCPFCGLVSQCSLIIRQQQGQRTHVASSQSQVQREGKVQRGWIHALTVGAQNTAARVS